MSSQHVNTANHGRVRPRCISGLVAYNKFDTACAVSLPRLFSRRLQKPDTYGDNAAQGVDNLVLVGSSTSKRAKHKLYNAWTHSSLSAEYTHLLQCFVLSLLCLQAFVAK